MAGEVRSNEEQISQAASLCFDFHSHQSGNLVSFKKTVASLQANWESRDPRVVFDAAVEELRLHADKQQAAIERMRDMLRTHGINVRDASEEHTREVSALEGEIASLRVGLSP